MTIAQKGIQFADQIDPGQFRIKGFVECVISVRDLEASSQFYRRISGWEECCTSTSSQEQLHFWLLPGSASAEEILMCNIGESNGHTRLVAFDNVDQDVIRANSMSWDTGGIYDLDIRVADMQATGHVRRWHHDGVGLLVALRCRGEIAVRFPTCIVLGLDLTWPIGLFQHSWLSSLFFEFGSSFFGFNSETAP